MAIRAWGIACLVLCATFGAAQLAPSGIDAENAPPAANGQVQSGAQPTDPAQNSSQNPASGKTPEQQEKEREIEREEQSQRALGVLPQFAVTNRRNAPPLTKGQKFHLFVKSAFDPVELGIVGGQAALSQAENEFPGYGQGMEGYGKRYGATLADEVSSGFWSNFFWASVLKEDPRYFRLGEGTFGHRFKYALVQEVICHTDKGGRSFSFENALGAFSAGGLANAYYPSSDRGFELTMSRSSIALGYGALGNLFEEFWPDIDRRLHKHRKNGLTQ